MQAPNLLSPRSVPETVLGVLLSAREIGLAVVRDNRLLEFGVTNLRKLQSRETKEQRARRALEQLIDDYTVTRIARIARAIPDRDLDPSGVVGAEFAWLEAEAVRRNLPLHAFQASRIRRALVGPDRRATNRTVSEAIALRFAELSKYAPSAQSAAGSHLVPELASRRSPMPTNRERYWTRVFLAAGAAAYDLDTLAQGGGAA